MSASLNRGRSLISVDSSMDENSTSQPVVVYKGQIVAITRVNKSEVSLIRQDLVELANVSELLC